ncbi:MAG: TRAP transporter TatT component family protein, partial [Candidatus Neomarinimicrobiota bacterium]
MNIRMRTFSQFLLPAALVLSGCAGPRQAHRKAVIHTGYAYAFLSSKADRIRDDDFRKARKIDSRARKHYTRAFQHGLSRLNRRYPGFEDSLSINPGRAVALTSRDDVPLLYWTGAALGATIGLSKDQPKMLIRLPQVGAMAFRVTELWPEYQGGVAYQLLMVYEASRAGILGGSIPLAKHYFQQALDYSEGANASLFVSYAESICIPEQDRDEFISMLNRALSIKGG